MKEYRVVWTAKAIKQLDRIYDFLARQDLIVAEKQVLALLEKVDLLKQFPQMGPQDPQLKGLKKEHRYVVEGNYKLVYRVKGRLVHIVLVFDTRQDPGKLKV